MKLAANPGMLLLAIWLILFGLGPLLNIDLGQLQNILAVAAGVLLLMNK